MTNKKVSLFIVVFFALFRLGNSMAFSSGTGTVSVSSWFQYDAKLPLYAKLQKQKETENYTLYHVKFNSAHQEKVIALFAVPRQGKPPYPFVLFQHGLTNKKEFILDWMGADAADMLAKEGFGVLAVDAPLHGERQKPGMKPFNMFGFGPYPYLARDSIAQSVVDLRRAVDFLESRKEADKTKIFYIGESMGALLGGTFTAIEKRIRAAVLVVGGGGLQFLFDTSLIGMKPEEKKKAVDEILFFVDPLFWIDKLSPRPLLMVGALQDELMPRDATERLYEKAKNPKKIVWIESKHVIPADKLFPVALPWLKEQMKSSVANK